MISMTADLLGDGEGAHEVGGDLLGHLPGGLPVKLPTHAHSCT